MSQNQNTPELRFEGFTEPWKGRKFGEEFLFLHNNTLSRAELCDADGDVFDVHYGDVLIKYSSVIDITKANLPRIIDAGKVSGCDSLHNGDVVIADTAEDETAGKCTELRGIDNEKVFSGLHTIPCRPRRIYASGFLGHYLNSRAFRKQLFPMMQGTKVVSISKTSMASTCLTVPSIEEQVTISEILSSIDSLIVLHQRKYERLQHLKQALLRKMFPKPGEPVPELRFKGFTEPWEERKLGEMLQTLPFKPFLKEPEQGGKYEIVQQGNNPVIGYANGIPCCDYKDTVIFGDHTLSLYKPERPFFVATDGVRIVKGKQNINGFFLLALLERYKPQNEGYKR